MSTATSTVKTLPPVVRRGATAEGDYSLVVTPETAGWLYSGMRVLELSANGRTSFDTVEDEVVVLPLSGGCVVDCEGMRFELSGRLSVFSRVTDFAYAPRDSHVDVSSAAGGRFALLSARATKRLEPRYGPAEDVAVELRGAGQASRQVNNFCSPDVFEADRLIAVEVLTPGGNWSSYPPHKHDENREGESVLEEIYYFELQPESRTAPPGDALGYQRVYTSGPGREIDVCTEVRTGDVVLIPYGYHGPTMAGPGPERAWRFCDDPAHAWIRDSWADQEVDPRLPLTSTIERRAL